MRQRWIDKETEKSRGRECVNIYIYIQGEKERSARKREGAKEKEKEMNEREAEENKVSLGGRETDTRPEAAGDGGKTEKHRDKGEPEVGARVLAEGQNRGPRGEKSQKPHSPLRSGGLHSPKPQIQSTPKTLPIPP